MGCSGRCVCRCAGERPQMFYRALVQFKESLLCVLWCFNKYHVAANRLTNLTLGKFINADECSGRCVCRCAGERTQMFYRVLVQLNESLSCVLGCFNKKK